MLDTITDCRARLERARSELIENERGLAALVEAKADASKAGREAFASWKDEFDWRATEKERLTILVETLEREIAEDRGAEAKIAFRERYNRRRAANEELAQRISSELAEINAKAIALFRDLAAAAIEDAELNAALPADVEPLIGANVLARARPGQEREVISTEQVWLWTRADNGAVIGDPDGVEDLGKGRGIIRRMAPLPSIHCRKMLFEQISFHPAEATQRPNAFWQVRLLDAEGPGIKFDGTEFSHPREVLAALDGAVQASGPRPRPVETEIRPAFLAKP
ncbi:hypothetical protein [Bradyrhizobium sp. 164]|uniref:hypothetical protein n=1 Tax=Bradyrhizobium sp. 164 TaxID=2782637 RepID=UPI001FF7DF8D|nr:hypothetical protein [Bradyrhizobium sp. 164]MCK1595870.1 hypothetical protein [Bradyrhizobium sp. 164]